MLLYVFLALLAYLIYIKFIDPINYWKKSKIFYIKPWHRILRMFNKSFYEQVIDAYNEFPDRRYYGSYQFFQPSLFVRDLDLVKKITVKDFEHFPDHHTFVSNDYDPVMSQTLFALKGDKWKDMRSTLSPAFTSAKMRSMYTLMQETAENFVNYFLGKNEDVIELEMKSGAFTKYTTDVIATCAFGITCDSLKDEKNEFFQMGTQLTTVKIVNILWSLAFLIFPKVFQFFRMSLFPRKLQKFFQSIIKDTITLREKENIIRPDMIHLLMEARKGRLKHEHDKLAEKETGFATVEESFTDTSPKMELTNDLITAQALIFFFAGFDTSSTVLSFLVYELALNPDLQSKLQKEIDETLKAGGGKISYEQILKMKYLDQVVSETLRKYPPGYALNRICEKDYKIEAKLKNEVDYVVKKGCLIAVPVCGIHMDAQYFPDPYKFDPDRFSDENKGNIAPGSYMPFGSGPRNCIASRFALLEAKTLTVSLFSKFNIIPTKKTTIPIKLSKTFNIAVKGGFWLGLQKR